jgi:hypothetical protein
MSTDHCTREQLDEFQSRCPGITIEQNISDNRCPKCERQRLRARRKKERANHVKTGCVMLWVGGSGTNGCKKAEERKIIVPL